jgi:hypothetical protein
LVEVLVLSQILNIKLPRFVMLSIKEVKKIHLKCTGVNRGLLTFCTGSTDFLLEYVYVVAVNCDPFGSLAPPPLFSINELVHIRSAYVNCFRTQPPRLVGYHL